MGDRGQVHIKDEDVFLYTHSGASTLIKDVYMALSKQWRWDDPEYLARIIFDVMTKNNHDSETGFGIGGEIHEDVWLLIQIDCKNQKIKVIQHKKIISNTSFDEFIKKGV
jgi:hypothetical protein